MMKRPAATSRGTKTRALILRTALHLFTTEGFFNTSIQDIQRAANVSIGSIYHHFGSKEQIAKALYQQVLLEMEQLVEQTFQAHGDAKSRCRYLIEQMLRLTDADPQTMQFVLYARHRELMPDSQPICSSRPFQRIRQMVEEGIEAGEIRAIDPWVAASSLFGGAFRMIQLKLDGMLEQRLQSYAEQLWDAAWRSVTTEKPQGSL
jgi:AcrR family transcriptional regulator